MQDGSYPIGRLKGISFRSVLGLVGMAAGIYLLSQFLAGFVLRFDPYYVYVAAIGVVIAVAVSQRIELAILLLALLAPYAIGESPGLDTINSSRAPSILPSELGLGMISAIWFITAFFKGKRIFPRCSFYLPVCVFFLVCLLSIISTFVTWDYGIPLGQRRLPNMVAETAMYGLCAVAFWLGASAFQKKDWIRPLFWPVVIGGLYNSLMVFARFVNPEFVEPINIVRGNFMTAFALTLVAARLLLAQEPRRRWLWCLGAVLLAGMYIDLSWVSGWLLSTTALAVVLMFKSPKAFAAFAAAGFFLLFIYPGVYYEVQHESRSQGDLDRLVLWHDAANMALSVNPALGIGPGMYPVYAKKYGTIWYGDETYNHAHSNYAQIIAETGFLGFLAFIWMGVAGIRTGIRCTRKVSRDFRWFAVASTAVFTGMAVAGLVGDYLMPNRSNGGIFSFGTSVFPWLLLGASVSAVRLSPRPDKQVDRSDERELVGEVIK